MRTILHDISGVFARNINIFLLKKHLLSQNQQPIGEFGLSVAKIGSTLRRFGSGLTLQRMTQRLVPTCCVDRVYG